MDFGLEFSRIFAADEDGKRKKAMMNRHNSAAGRKVTSFNPFYPDEMCYSFQLDQSTSLLWVLGWYFSFLFKF